MQLIERLKQYQQVLFYPFSGSDFEIINHLKLHKYPTKVLYLFCSIATLDEHDKLQAEEQCGLFDNVEFLENKMGLKGFALNEKSKLDSPFDSYFYKLENDAELIFVKANVFSLLEYLNTEKHTLSNFNLLIKGGGRDTPIFKIFDFIHPNFVLTDNYWRNMIQKHFEGKNCYQICNEYETEFHIFHFSKVTRIMHDLLEKPIY